MGVLFADEVDYMTKCACHHGFRIVSAVIRVLFEPLVRDRGIAASIFTPEPDASQPVPEISTRHRQSRLLNRLSVNRAIRI